MTDPFRTARNGRDAGGYALSMTSIRATLTLVPMLVFPASSLAAQRPGALQSPSCFATMTFMISFVPA